MLNRLQTLQDQGIQNNQQIMAIILEMDEKEASKQNGVYDKLQEAKNDASKLLQKEDSYMDVSFFIHTIFVSIVFRDENICGEERKWHVHAKNKPID